MGNNLVTRLPNGITNVGADSIFADMAMPVPTLFATYFNDFFTYTAGDWVVTETQAGATQALASGSAGWLLLTNSAADDDLNALQKTPAMLTLAAAKKTFFSARFKVSDATQSDFVMGLQVVDTTPLDVTDGIYFLKSDGSTSIAIVARKDATTGSTSATGIGTAADDTFVLLEWAYDGAGVLTYAVDGAVKGSLNIASYFPDSILTVSFGIQNGEAVAKTMTVDYVGVWQER